MTSDDQDAICCHGLTLGLLISGFEDLGHCCSQPPASGIHCGVNILHRTLIKTKLYQWREMDYSGSRDHHQCNFTSEMRDKLDKVYNAVPSAVSNEHLRHLQKQWAKGRTKA